MRIVRGLSEPPPRPASASTCLAVVPRTSKTKGKHAVGSGIPVVTCVDDTPVMRAFSLPSFHSVTQVFGMGHVPAEVFATLGPTLFVLQKAKKMGYVALQIIPLCVGCSILLWVLCQSIAVMINPEGLVDLST